MHSFKIKYCPILVIILLLSVMSFDVTAQCAMCSLNAENSTIEGNTQGAGLNNGILFLLAMPFLIAGLVGIVWYKFFRKKGTSNHPIFENH